MYIHIVSETYVLYIQYVHTYVCTYVHIVQYVCTFLRVIFESSGLNFLLHCLCTYVRAYVHSLQYVHMYAFTCLKYMPVDVWVYCCFIFYVACEFSTFCAQVRFVCIRTYVHI